MPKRPKVVASSNKNKKRKDDDNVVVVHKDDDDSVHGVVVVDDDHGTYFMVDSVVDCRFNEAGEHWEYLVQWAGCDEKTWEPQRNLCGGSLKEALELRRRCRMSRTQKSAAKDDNETASDGDDDRKMRAQETDTSSSTEEALMGQEEEQMEGVLLDGEPDWSSAIPIEYREIERIHVDDPSAAQRVTDARLNGVPVCLVGHRGWAQFAKRWLEPVVDLSLQEVGEPQQSTCGITQQQASGERQQLIAENPMQQHFIAELQPPAAVTAMFHDNALQQPQSGIATQHQEIEVETSSAKESNIERMASPSSVKENITDDKRMTDSPPSASVVPQQIMPESLRMDSLPVPPQKPRSFIGPEKTAMPLAQHPTLVDLSHLDVGGDVASFEAAAAAQRLVSDRLVDSPPMNPDRLGQDSDTEVVDNSPQKEKTEHGRVEWDNDELLDLSKSYRLCLNKMVEDVGSEWVPIRRKRDGYRDPNKKKALLKNFVKNCWQCSDKGERTAALSGEDQPYLHQWQFPLSETAVHKLCGPGANIPLPNGILGDDLLRYWHEKELYLGDNPYQYIFMGRDGTMSELHRDNGGLLITIAPIIGEKEVILVHRAEDPNLLENLERSNMDRYPLMFKVRAWRTVVRPGEILIMPEGTYHQCRNVTPCLSYHRFVLDEHNLVSFLNSFFAGDAPEIAHDDCLWNTSFEFHSMVDKFANEARRDWKRTRHVCPWDETPRHVVQAVDTLRKLLSFVKDMAAKLHEKRHEDNSAWYTMVDDIKDSLHNFKYRYFEKLPQRLGRKMMFRKNNIQAALMPKEAPQDNGSHQEENYPASHSLEKHFRRASNLLPSEANTVISDSEKIKVGDHVVAKVHGKKLHGTIADICKKMEAAFVEYEGMHTCHSEYMPLGSLRVNVEGQSPSAIQPNTHLPVGKLVYQFDKGVPILAKVKSCRKGTFYLVSLDLGNSGFKVVRWLCRESLLSKCIGQVSGTKQPPPGLLNNGNKVLDETIEYTVEEVEELVQQGQSLTPVVPSIAEQSTKFRTKSLIANMSISHVEQSLLDERTPSLIAQGIRRRKRVARKSVLCDPKQQA